MEFERLTNGNVLLKTPAGDIVRSFPPVVYINIDNRDSDIFNIDSNPGASQDIQHFEIRAGSITVPSHTGRSDLIRQLSEDFFFRVNDKHYKHIQGVAATIWNVTHNLNKFPAVTVIDSQDNEVEGGVEYIDENNVQLCFSAPFSGCAYFN